MEDEGSASDPPGETGVVRCAGSKQSYSVLELCFTCVSPKMHAVLRCTSRLAHRREKSNHRKHTIQISGKNPTTKQLKWQHATPVYPPGKIFYAVDVRSPLTTMGTANSVTFWSNIYPSIKESEHDKRFLICLPRSRIFWWMIWVLDFLGNMGYHGSRWNLRTRRRKLVMQCATSKLINNNEPRFQRNL